MTTSANTIERALPCKIPHKDANLTESSIPLVFVATVLVETKIALAVSGVAGPEGDGHPVPVLQLLLRLHVLQHHPQLNFLLVISSGVQTYINSCPHYRVKTDENKFSVEI
jgi:hypothetical protein